MPSVMAKFLKAKARASGAKKPLGKKVKNLTKRVRAIERSEPKYVTGSSATTSLVNSTPINVLLNGMQQGDTNILRDGNRVKWNNIEMRILIEGLAAHVFAQPVRFMLVRKIPSKGATITLSNLISDASPDFLDIYNVTSIDFKATYKVYFDKTFVIGPESADYTSATGNAPGGLKGKYCLTIRKNLGGFVTDYGLGNAGTVADIDTNGLHFIAFTDNATADAIGFHFSWILRGREV